MAADSGTRPMGSADGSAGKGDGMNSAPLRVGRYTVTPSNAGKVLFPSEGITKGDLIVYYRDVAAVMLPYLRDRPLVMVRHPNGIDDERIFQRNVPDHFPGWVTRVPVRKCDGEVLHAVCDKAATLVYLANQACVELHVLLSRVDRLDAPDQLVFDLDPPSVERFPDARRAALDLRTLLEESLGVTAFPRTTGGKGLHVHVPLNRHAGFDEVRAVAREIADLLAAARPGRLTTEQRKAKRGDRLFIDILRNGYAQTVVAPYSVRARPGAPVSMPLHWEEVEDADLRPDRFTMRTVRERLHEFGDAWTGMHRHRYTLDRLRDRLNRLTTS
jgi:bifunctional non-homologous end joining protein LigD